MRRISTSVTITDPLVKYYSLLQTGVYSPDPAQHRLARHLQKLYLRLKDYTPREEYGARLKELTQELGRSREAEDRLAVKNHPIWQKTPFSKLRRGKGGKDNLALTRILTSHQAALQVDSPRGLFLSGEVGTGKSMLIDLLADGLPTSRKRRWHFNTFMLCAFSRLEQFRKAHSQLSKGDQEYSLLWMAREMVENSPVLFLDEFQLPDRAASKLLSHLFIAFFQLGGVLVASSNRMPDELEKAIGVQHTVPPSGGFVGQVLGLGRRSLRGELYGQTSDFAAFLEVLKARCDFWNLEGARDWRRRDAQSTLDILESQSHEYKRLISEDALLAVVSATSGANRTPEKFSSTAQHEGKGLQCPPKYIMMHEEPSVWEKAVQQTLGGESLREASWKASVLIVYGRELPVAKHCAGVTYWDFEEIVSRLGPTDYITLASNYHIFIIDGIPELTTAMKNEARRFITLLDTLYEARCKLLIRAAAGPDHLFFPETVSRREQSAVTSVAPDNLPRTPVVDKDNALGETSDADATYSETIAEVFQDQMSPFRPNISMYSGTSRTAATTRTRTPTSASRRARSR